MDGRTGAALALSLVLAACHRTTPDVAVGTTRGDTSNVTITTGGSTVTMRSGGAAAAPAMAAAPGPAELAAIERYPGATVKSNTSITTAGSTGGSAIVSFETPDRPAAVIAFYRAAAARAGYQVEAALDLGGMALLSGKRRDGMAFQLSVSRSGDSSTATLITGAGS